MGENFYLEHRIHGNKNDIENLHNRLNVLEKQLNCDGYHEHYWVNTNGIMIYPIKCKHCNLKQYISPGGAIKYGN